MKKHVFIIIFFFIPFALFAQIQNALIKGVVLDKNENPISNANVVILGKTQGVSTSDSGTFSIKVPAQKAFALIFTHTGYAEFQQNFFLNNGDEKNLTIHLNEISKTLDVLKTKFLEIIASILLGIKLCKKESTRRGKRS
jgi:hypothetical protein